MTDELDGEDLRRLLNDLEQKSSTPAERRKRELEKNLWRKATYFQRLFTSPDGKVVLEALEKEFDQTSIITPGDPFYTHYNLGARDVVTYIKQMINYNPNEEQ